MSFHWSSAAITRLSSSFERMLVESADAAKRRARELFFKHGEKVQIEILQQSRRT
jgi:hypothetical protein